LKKPRILLGLLMALAVVVSMVVAMPVLGAAPAFTGNVEIDFLDTDPSISVCTDPGGQDVFVDEHPSAPISSGWDIKDVRLAYDSATDILYVGLNSYQTVGDADTDGNEGLETYLDSGIDVPNLGEGESVAVYFDLDKDGDWDVVAGVPTNADFSGFTLRNATGTMAEIASFGATDLTAHLGTRYWMPGTAPDLEFRILGFADLPSQGGQLSEFTVGAFMGSIPDVDVTEDVMIYSVSLPVPPPPVGGTAFPVNKLGLLTPWGVLLGCAGVVTLLMLRQRRQA